MFPNASAVRPVTLEPEISDFIELSDSLYQTGVDDSVENQRDVYNTVCRHFTPPHPPGLHNRYYKISGIPMRWYWTDDNQMAPCIVYFHGGGFVVGGLESHDFICAKLAVDSHCKVVSVDYRLAPEHRFPAAFDDCYSVLQALQNNPDDFGIDANKIVLCGDSAGGNLTAAVALANRDHGGSPLAGQIMIYPRLIDDITLPSYTECATAPQLSTADVEYYHRIYLGDYNDTSAYFAPAMSERFDELPPALLLPVEYDPLRDDAFLFHEKLLAAGTDSELHLGKGLVHGCLRAIEISPGVQLMYRKILEFVGEVIL